MVSRDALNIDGLSEMTLEKLIDEGFIRTYADLFRLERFRNDIAALDGFGEKSADNLIAAAKKASETDLYRFLYGLGVPGIGLAGSKAICRHFGNDPEAVINAGEDELLSIRDIGPVLAANYVRFFNNAEHRAEASELLKELSLRQDESGAADIEKIFDGMTFVITGDVEHFANRREVQDIIELLGGKASGSVSAKTTYLINNDIMSSSSKNQKAKSLNIPIITEEQFIELLPEDRRPQ